MSYEKLTYYIILKKRSRGYEILYNIGSENNVTTVLRLNGKSADRIFKGVISALAKQGAVIPTRVSDSEQVYSIREDLGPVVGAYLILVRKARNIEKWDEFFRKLLDGHFVGVAKVFSALLELAIELSRSMPTRSGRGYALSPVVVDALSMALKRFVGKISKSMRIE